MAVDSGTYSKDDIERKRKIADALLQQSFTPQPIQHWTQGLAELARAGIGGYLGNQAEKQDDTRKKGILAALLGTDSTGAPPPLAPDMGGGTSQPSAPPAPATPSQAPVKASSGAAPEDQMASPYLLGDARTNAAAIGQIESGGSGGYNAIGPTTAKGDRAYGKYQVMGSNIGPWTKEVLGQELTPEQFLNSKEAQDQVFAKKFQGASPQDAASRWFTGKPLAQGANAQDILGTTGSQYVNKFNQALFQQGGYSPNTQTASNGNSISNITSLLNSGGQPQNTQVASLDPSIGLSAPPTVTNTVPTDAQTAQQTPAPSPVNPVQQPMDISAAGVNSAPSQIAQALQAPTSTLAPQGNGGLLGNMPPAQRAVVEKLLKANPDLIDKLVPELISQQVSKPTFTKIGMDENGQEIYGWANAANQTVTDTSGHLVSGGGSGTGQPFSSSNNSGVDRSKSGDEFMADLEKKDPVRAAKVRALDSGEMPFPTGMSQWRPVNQALLNDLYRYNPNASAQSAGTVKAFNTGEPGKISRFQNAASAHLDLFGQLAKGLANGDNQTLNSIRNKWQAEFGAPMPNNIDLAKQFVGDEVIKAVTSSGGAESDRINMQKTFDAAKSPQQLAEAVETAKGFMRGQSQALQKQYEAGSGRKDYRQKYMTDEAREALYPTNSNKSQSDPIEEEMRKRGLIK